MAPRRAKPKRLGSAHFSSQASPPTAFTCPDYHGPFTQLLEGEIIRYRYPTGHAYTSSTLLSEITQSVESLLYQSLRRLAEAELPQQQLGEHFGQHHQPAVAAVFWSKAAHAGVQVHAVHASILQNEALGGDLQFQARATAPALAG